MTESKRTLSGQVAVVTGGAGGIGGATASVLVSDGADVLISGRTQSALEATADRLRRWHSAPTDAFGVTPQTVATLNRRQEPFDVGVTPSRAAKKSRSWSSARRVGDPSASEYCSVLRGCLIS